MDRGESAATAVLMTDHDRLMSMRAAVQIPTSRRERADYPALTTTVGEQV